MVQCSIVEVDRRFRGAYCVHHQSDDEGSTCEISSSHGGEYEVQNCLL